MPLLELNLDAIHRARAQLETRQRAARGERPA